MKVLIIDDSQLIIEKLSELIFEINGVDIIATAKSKSEALEKFKLYHPDLVILDLQLKKGSGIDVLKEIKKQSPQTFVAILTNYPEMFNRIACMEAGANIFLDKSIEFEKINNVCKNLKHFYNT